MVDLDLDLVVVEDREPEAELQLEEDLLEETEETVLHLI